MEEGVVWARDRQLGPGGRSPLPHRRGRLLREPGQRLTATQPAGTSSSCLLHLPALPLTLASPSTSLHQTATVDALLEAWGRRSGKRLLRYEWLHNTTNAHASQAAHANSHRHPKLEDDVTDLADRAALSELYRGSNQQVYRLIREDARLTVLPNGPASGAYDGAFLDAVWDREGR